MSRSVIRETVNIKEWYSRDRRHALSGIRETVDVEECHSRDRRCALPPNISFLLVELLAHRTRV